LCGVCKSRNSTLLVNFEKATINDIIDKALVLPIEEGGAGIDLEDIAILEGNRYKIRSCLFILFKMELIFYHQQLECFMILMKRKTLNCY
jgi:hypothetical protein